MTTTLEIPDELFREANEKAASEGIELKDFVAESLRLMLGQTAATRKRVEFPIVRCPPGTSLPELTDDRIKELEIEADLERHAASLRR